MENHKLSAEVRFKRYVLKRFSPPDLFVTAALDIIVTVLGLLLGANPIMLVIASFLAALILRYPVVHLLANAGVPILMRKDWK